MNWINPEDKLPTEYIDVLVVFETFAKSKRDAIIREIWIGKYCNCKGWIKRFPDNQLYFGRDGKELNHRILEAINGQYKVICWMNLPEIPI